MTVVRFPLPSEVSEKTVPGVHPWLLPLILGVLLTISLVLSYWLIRFTPADPNSTEPINPFFTVYVYAFLPYLAACGLVFFTRPAGGRWSKLEVGLILGGALLLRVVLLPLSPNLSHDSWRYVWDARVFLHGYSPYVYAPGNPLLVGFRDFIFANSRFRNVPSLYPPGAQYIYALSYLLVPSSLTFLKGVFVLCDLGSCVVLMFLLIRRGLDPARLLLYAWCPLPIIEFALQGHVDVLPILFSLLAMLASEREGRWGRVLTGFLIGMGMLTKVYPILLLAAVVRLRDWRRDWLLALTCVLTIVVGYLPFIIQGHGQIFGFFSTYANEQGQNAGVIQQWIFSVDHVSGVPLATILTQEHLTAFFLLAGASLAIFLLHQFQRIRSEAGALILFGLVLSVSSHVFPWYTTTLLPWIVLLLPGRGKWVNVPCMVARILALCSVWLFACVSITGYFADWRTYYLTVYDPLVIELGLSALIFMCAYLVDFARKGIIYEKR